MYIEKRILRALINFYNRVTRGRTDVNNDDVKLAGWLWKKGQLNTAFKRRYFFLEWQCDCNLSIRGDYSQVCYYEWR